MTAVSSEIFVSTNETCFERTKMQLMETEILHKITTMKGEETVNSEFNNLVSGGDSSKYDRLDRKTAMEAFLRYGLLSSLEDLGLLGSVHADLSRKNGGLAASLRKWEPVIAKANTEKWYMWKREKKEKKTHIPYTAQSFHEQISTPQNSIWDYNCTEHTHVTFVQGEIVLTEWADTSGWWVL
jgi:hypothetical protein